RAAALGLGLAALAVRRRRDRAAGPAGRSAAKDHGGQPARHLCAAAGGGSVVMNVVRPIAAPGRPAAATLGLFDCDIHPRPLSLEEYRPWLSAEMWHRVQTYGIRARHGFAKGYPFPKAAPLASRRDAWPQGKLPGTDLDFMRQQ